MTPVEIIAVLVLLFYVGKAIASWRGSQARIDRLKAKRLKGAPLRPLSPVPDPGPAPEPKAYIERREVLDDGFVELIDFMGIDGEVVADEARVSFDKRASEFPLEKNLRLLDYLDKHDHGSPWEMAVFKFRIRAPLVVWWQFVRHRMASYNFKSGRYVPFDETEVYRPHAWRAQSETNKQGSDGFIDQALGKRFDEKRDALYEQAFSLYQTMLDYGVAKEQARLVLPGFAVYYDAIVLMNARSLRNFLKLRLGKDAQSEIRFFAEAIDEILKTTHPNTFDR